MASSDTKLPTRVAALIFPGFQPLDLAGPLDVLQSLSTLTPLSLVTLTSSPTSLDPVPTVPTTFDTPLNRDFSWSLQPTHTFANPPKWEDLDVVLVPGGYGTRAGKEGMAEAVAWLEEGDRLMREGKWGGYILSVCTGAVVLGWAGILDGRKATTNKRSWTWATTPFPNTKWVGRARWAVDGNVWTASGVAAGLDMILAWVSHVYDGKILNEVKGVADEIADRIEYRRQKDSSWDPFAERWGVVTAEQQQ